jgi:hypothetical protein
VFPLFSSNKRGERRVSPRVYRLLLSTHIIVSVGWLGIVFAKLILGLHAMTSDAPDVSDALRKVCAEGVHTWPHYRSCSISRAS